MKKKLIAYALAVLCGAVLIMGLALLNVLVVLVIFPVGFALAAALCFGAAFGVHIISKKLCQRIDIGRLAFIICVYLPATLGGIISYFVVLYLDSIDYFTGMMAGLGEYVFSLSAMVTPLVMFVSTEVIIIAGKLLERRNGE
ncbi:MAG: hypothetical protein E7478_01470 [Ruminococcaceae bacterium]|nr:hypothetical protein [Oscillospiraceae bacterium]